MNKNLKIISLIYIILVFTSCNSSTTQWNWFSLSGLAVLLLGLFALTFYLIFRLKNQEHKKMAQYTASVSQMLAKCKSREGKVKELLILIDRINKDPKYAKSISWRNKVLAKTYLFLATQYYELNDEEKTLETCSKILELTPDDAMTLYNRGSIYLNKKNYNEAITDFTESLHLVSQYANTYNNRGMAYEAIGNFDKAMADYEEAIALEPSAITYYNMGNVFAKTNNTAKAKEYYLKAMKLNKGENAVLKNEIDNSLSKLG